MRSADLNNTDTKEVIEKLQEFHSVPNGFLAALDEWAAIKRVEELERAYRTGKSLGYADAMRHLGELIKKLEGD